jgi:hypothetical protein
MFSDLTIVPSSCSSSEIMYPSTPYPISSGISGESTSYLPFEMVQIATDVTIVHDANGDANGE